MDGRAPTDEWFLLWMNEQSETLAYRPHDSIVVLELLSSDVENPYGNGGLAVL